MKKKNIRLPKTVTYTISQKKTSTPIDAFSETLLYIMSENKSEIIRDILIKAKEELSKNNSFVKCCQNAYEVIMNSGPDCEKYIFDRFPKELLKLLDDKFFITYEN